MHSDVFVVFRACNAVRPGQSLQVAQVKLAKLIKAYGFRPAAFITAYEVEKESATVHHREGASTVKALRFNFHPHSDLLFFETERHGSRARVSALSALILVAVQPVVGRLSLFK